MKQACCTNVSVLCSEAIPTSVSPYLYFVRNSGISSARSTGFFFFLSLDCVLCSFGPLASENWIHASSWGINSGLSFLSLWIWNSGYSKGWCWRKMLDIVSHCYADPTVTFLFEHKRVSNWVSAFKAAILSCVSEDSSEDCVLHCVSLCIIIFWMFYSLLPNCSESCLSFSVDLIIFSPQRSAVLYCAYLTSSTWLFWLSLLTGSSRS